jgi:hypothetical protein
MEHIRACALVRLAQLTSPIADSSGGERFGEWWTREAVVQPERMLDTFAPGDWNAMRA